MLTFLRKIRRSIIDSGSSGRYLVYALGEIVLVMLGILLALQVNNWNQKRLDAKGEREALQQLSVEVDKNIQQFQVMMMLHDSIFTNVQIVLDYLNSSNQVTIDQKKLERAMGWVAASHVTFNPSEGIINSLMSSGKIDIIRNDSLKALLIQWKDLVKDYQEEELELDELRDRVVIPEALKLGDFAFDRETNKLSGRLDADSQDFRYFKNGLTLVSQYKHFLMLEYDVAWNESVKMQKTLQTMRRLIDQELD